MAHVEAVLSRLRGVKRTSGGWSAFCPAHENKKTQALSVSVGSDGRVLFKCFSQDCTFEQIAAALDYEPKELMGDDPFRSSVVTPIRESVTLAALAEKVGISQDWLQNRLGWMNTRTGTAVAIPYKDTQGAHLYSKLRVSINGAPKYKFAGQGTTQTLYGLRPLRRFRERDRRLYLVEGETDAATLWHAQLPAAGIPGSNAISVLHAPHVKGFQEIFGVRENDAAGAKFVQRLGEHLLEIGFAGSYKVLSLPPDFKDTNELYRDDPENFKAAWLNLAHEAEEWTQESGNQRLIRFADLGEPEPIKFLWEPYIPQAEVMLMAGKPGIGKSLATVRIAAALSRGIGLPGDNEPRKPVASLFMAGEDDPHTQLLPRAVAAGGDKKLLFAVNREGWDVDLWQEECMEDLAKELRANKIGLLIIDPIQAWVGHVGFNLNDAMHVRRVMKGLRSVSQNTGCTILVVAHDRKSEVATAIDAILGSRDLTAAVRSVCMLFSHPTRGDGWGMLAHAKHNYSSAGKSLEYRIDSQDGRPQLTWGKALDVTAEDLVQDKQIGQDMAAREEAVAILEGLLVDGKINTKTAYKEGRESGISATVMRRARKDLGLVHRRMGTAHFWFEPPQSEDESQNLESLGNVPF